MGGGVGGWWWGVGSGCDDVEYRTWHRDGNNATTMTPAGRGGRGGEGLGGGGGGGSWGGGGGGRKNHPIIG